MDTAKELKNGLAAVKPTALDNVRLDHETGRVWLTTTNLETLTRVPVQYDGPCFDSIAIPFVALEKIVGALVKAGINRLELQTELCKLTVKADATTAEVNGTSIDDFPIVNGSDWAEIAIVDVGVLEEIIQRVIPFTCTSESRPTFQAVNLTCNPDVLTARATDGFRLAVLTVPSNGRYAGPAEPAELLPFASVFSGLRFRGIGAIAGEGETASIQHDGNGRVRLTFESGATVTGKIGNSGRYPDFNQVIPPRENGSITLDATNYIQALEFVKPFTKGSANIVKHHIDGNVFTVLADSDAGTVSREMTGVVTGEMPAFALNCSYALELAKAATWASHHQQRKELTISGTTPNSPFVFSAGSDWLGVCMPMYIRK